MDQFCKNRPLACLAAGRHEGLASAARGAAAALAITLLLVAGIGLAGAQAANTVAYACEGGGGFAAIFDNAADTLTLEMPEDVRVVLNPAPTGSGMRYTGGGYEFYGKGEWANLRRPGVSELRCREAAGRDDQPRSQ